MEKFSTSRHKPGKGSHMLIKNCTLIDGAEIFEEKMDLRIHEGKIAEAAACLTPQDGEEVLDAAGAIVTPGFIDGSCQVGVNSQIYRSEENDGDDAKAVSPEMRAYDALNLADEGFEMALRAGVTCVVSGPGNANLIGGTCAAVKTAGENREGKLGVEERILDAEAAYRFCFTNEPRRKFGGKNQSPQTRMGSAAMIRDILLKAKEYARKEKAGEKQEYKLELAALARVFDGMPVQMAAMKSNDIMTAIRIGEEFGLNYVLVMAYDGLTACRDLQRKDFRFMIGPLYGMEFSAEAAGMSLDLGTQMEKEGIHAAISTGHPAMSIELVQTQLALMVDRGLSRKEAIKGMTAYPAKYLGLDSRVGTLEPGKDADFVIWDGDPLTYEGGPAKVFIEGREVKIQ